MVVMQQKAVLRLAEMSLPPTLLHTEDIELLQPQKSMFFMVKTR